MSDQLTEPAFIAIGSNIEPERHIPASLSHLRELGLLRAVSRVYQSPPVGDRDQADYLNAAALLELVSEPAAIRQRLRSIEEELGRVRTDDKYASRTIDLDLVILGDRIDKEFPLPDPEILIHGHLAVPLSDLAPDFCHPVTGEALAVIGARLSDAYLTENPKLSQRLTDIFSESR